MNRVKNIEVYNFHKELYYSLYEIKDSSRKLKFLTDKRLFNTCKDLYNGLYSIDGLKDLLDSSEKITLVKSSKGFIVSDNIIIDYNYVNDLFEKISFSLSNVNKIVLSNIFKYKEDMVYLYEGGCSLHEGVLRCFSPKDLDYPKASDVLIPKDNIDTWLTAKPSKFFVESINKINNYVISGETPNMFRVHMVGNNLVLSYYTVNNKTENYIYGNDENLDKLLENIIKVSHRFSFSVKDIYWYTEGTYSKTNARKNSDGEYTLVIS